MKKIENKEICLGDIGTCKGRKNSGIIGRVNFVVVDLCGSDGITTIQIEGEKEIDQIWTSNFGVGPNGGKLAYQDKGRVFGTSDSCYENGAAVTKYCGFKFNK